MNLGRTMRLVFGVGALVAVGVMVGARYVPTSRASMADDARALHVPQAKGPITLDGELGEAAWLRATARTNAFVTESGDDPARPYSDARMLWGGEQLYVALYAADEDIRPGDLFHVELEGYGKEHVRRILDVAPFGPATEGGIRFGRDLDGTVGDASDDDEEWVVEVAIPLRSLGLTGQPGERIAFSVHRCDTPKGGTRFCGSWGEVSSRVLVLDGAE